MSRKGIATVRVEGLGYVVEYFTLNDPEILHATVHHVDAQVRSVAPVWLPHIPPTPLCGLGRGPTVRTVVARVDRPLCRPCQAHLAELDEWVRQAEAHLAVS